MSLLHDVPPRIAARLLSGVIAKGPPGGVYLTFDDGPDSVTTPKFLKILEDLNSQATFFLTGSKIDTNREIVRRMVDAGHTIGSHAFHHYSLLKANCNRAKIEINASLSAIEAASGVRPGLFRPPYGRIARSGCSVTRQLGLTVVLWSLSAEDWRESNPTKISSDIISKVSDGDIILLHDAGQNAGTTLEALPLIIEGIRSKGLRDAPLPRSGL
jgi:peptidoglycan/xylan/chitin deacetylase (PgdA/CDA1 family)